MATIRRSEAGVGHLVALLLVVFVAVAGLAGYYVWNANQDKAADPANNSSQTSVVPNTIKTKADLTATSKFLDETATELDSGLNASSLDGDINELL